MPSQKQLLLIMRHAESNPGSKSGSDFDRTLSTLGKIQPNIIAQKLIEKDITVNTAIISPSMRTKETYKILAGALKQNINVILDERLYAASEKSFLQVILDHAQHAQTLLIIAHCPAVNQVVEYLSRHIVNFATADIAILKPPHNSIKDALDNDDQFDLLGMISPHE